MATWEKICRVCSSPANYELFAKIPAYLHASSNEFINWQKPINVLMEETTGLKVTQEDGLPKSICALCISYLKHAVTFRDQVIKNALSLQVVKKLRDEQFKKDNIDKNSILITEQELCMSDTRSTDANMLANTMQNDHHNQPKVSKSLFQAPITAPSQEYVVQQMRYLNLLFDKDINSGIAEIGRQNEAEGFTANRSYVDPMADYETESTSNEENDGDNYISSSGGVSKGIFSYTEKNFEEDDIMNLEELRASINVNIPEDCKERKCRACFRRFMFEDSYKQHMDNCIEFKFLNFIEEINLLLDIRRKKAVSPHEFIRRMIFSLRKVCEFLKINCDEILLPPELGINNETNKTRSESKEKENLEETVLYAENLIQHNSPVNFTSTNETNNYNLTELLLRSNSQPQDLTDSATPISMHNNILYEIERSQSHNTDIDKPKNINILDNNVKLMRPIPMHAVAKTQQITKSPTSPAAHGTEDERFKFLQKLEQAIYQTPQRSSNERSPLVTPSISVRKDLMPKTVDMPISPFSAACNTCNLIFDTISGFELHNAMYHNESANEQTLTDDQRQRRKSDEERERIIAMFENEDDI